MHLFRIKRLPQTHNVFCFSTGMQLQDLVRFLTNDKVFGTFTADTTYNLGEFCYSHHLQALDASTRKHPTMAGPACASVSEEKLFFV